MKYIPMIRIFYKLLSYDEIIDGIFDIFGSLFEIIIQYLILAIFSFYRVCAMIIV